MKPMRHWLSFDLGLRGNYDELYEWLDKMEARECGDSMATFVTAKSREQITKELLRFLDGKTRIYLVNSKQGGKFIIGKRKRDPWAGYAEASIDTGDES